MADPFADLVPSQSAPVQGQGAPLGSDANPVQLRPGDAGPPAGVSYITPGGVHWLSNGQPAGATEGQIQARFGGNPTGPASVSPSAAAPQDPFADLTPTQGVSQPTAPDFREPGFLGGADSIARTIARGVPILGQAADYGNAAVNATLAPFVEPVLDMIPGHDRKWDIAGGQSWQDRYDRAFAMQRGMDHQVDQDQPIASAAGQFVGGGLGILASGGLLTPAESALAKFAPSAGLLPQMAAGAIDGAGLGAGTGYLSGDGAWNDQSRWHDAGNDAAIGTLAGGAAPGVFSAGKSLWGATIGKALDALTGPVRVGAPSGPPMTATDILAHALGPANGAEAVSPEAHNIAQVLEQSPQTAAQAGAGLPAAPGSSVANLTDAVAARARAPSVTVPKSAADAAYDRIFQALGRSGQSPGEALGQAQTLGPFGMLADTSVPVQDFARTVADAPGQGGQIAKDALNLRQSGVLESGQYSVRPAALRIADTLGQSLGVSDRTAAGDTAGLLAAQKASAGPAYAKAYSAAPVAVSDLQDFASAPIFRQAYDRAKAISEKTFVKMADGTEKIQPIPDFESLGVSQAPGRSAGPPPLIDPAANAEGLARARADADLYGQRQSGDLLSAIRARGGVRVKDANGQRYLVGPDMDALAVQRPGVINNRSGMLPENMAESLHEDGWFGTAEDPSKAFEEAWNNQAGGRPVYHPNADRLDYNYRKANFDQEADAAGVTANDSPAAAAAKLHALRSGDAAERAAIEWEGNLNDPDGQEFDRLAGSRGPTLGWRTLDLVKQAMDDQIREGRVQGIGANDQAATTGFLSRYVAKLDALNPHYAAARDAFAGPAKLMDAVDAGRQYLSEDAPAIGSTMAGLSPSEQEAFRVGAVQAERDRLGSVPDTYNAAMRAGVNTPGRLSRLRQLFPDADTFGRYADMLQGENTMFGTRSRVLGGSLTSKNLGHAADADHNPLEMLAEAGELAHNPAGGSLRLLGRLLSAGNGQRMSEPTSDAAASILFNTNRDAFPDFSAELAAAAKRAAIAKALASGATPAASASAIGLANVLHPQGAQ